MTFCMHLFRLMSDSKDYTRKKERVIHRRRRKKNLHVLLIKVGELEYVSTFVRFLCYPFDRCVGV